MSISPTSPDPTNDEPEAHHEKAIVINGRPYEVTEKELTYEEVVNLTYDNNPPGGPGMLFTITYTEGKHEKEGSLQPGGTVKVKAGMRFSVTPTNKS
jgi:hypothetical protein